MHGEEVKQLLTHCRISRGARFKKSYSLEERAVAGYYDSNSRAYDALLHTLARWNLLDSLGVARIAPSITSATVNRMVAFLGMFSAQHRTGLYKETFPFLKLGALVYEFIMLGRDDFCRNGL